MKTFEHIRDASAVEIISVLNGDVEQAAKSAVLGDIADVSNLNLVFRPTQSNRLRNPQWMPVCKEAEVFRKMVAARPIFRSVSVGPVGRDVE